MELDRIEIDQTALLFFDILNGYYHEASDAAKQRKKPMVDNAVRLMKAARRTGMPIFFAKGSHREDFIFPRMSRVRTTDQVLQMIEDESR